MIDQAEQLRLRVKRQMNGKMARTIAIISGKGGVGKSNFSLNFAINLSEVGKKVLLFDLDIGMGNIDLLIGKTPQKTMANFFLDGISLQMTIEEGPEGIHFIAGGTGLNQFISMDKDRMDIFFKEINDLLYDYDYLLFDIGAGMSEETVRFLSTVEHLFVIVTPEPTSIMDAYSAIKFIHMNVSEANFFLIGNKMKNEKESQNTLQRLSVAMLHFIQKKAEILGYIPDDPQVGLAVRRQIPFTIFKPSSPSAKQLWKITNKYIEKEAGNPVRNEPEKFIERLKSFLMRK